jgi:hypothetical protein
MAAKVTNQDDLDEKLKVGQDIILLCDLPSRSPLIKAGTTGTVESFSRWQSPGNKSYSLRFQTRGDNKPIIILQDVRRDQFRVAAQR